MAYLDWHDPYQGWSAMNPYSNVTAHEILTDTSGRWHLVLDLGGFRYYQRTP